MPPTRRTGPPPRPRSARPRRRAPCPHRALALALALALGLAVLATLVAPARASRAWYADATARGLQLTSVHTTPLEHALEKVGPALANATQTALTAGEQLLTQYADLLRLIAIPCGLALAFFGYFLLGPVLFTSGFVVGGGSCFVAVYAVLDTDSSATAWLAIIASLLGGALLAFLALHALPVGLFAAGASLGLVIASALRPAVLPHFFPHSPRLAFIVTAVLCAVLFGLLALVVQKQMLIFSTSYGGAGAAAYGVGRFLRHFPTARGVDELVTKGELDAWLLLYAAVAFGLGTIGMVFQSWLARDRPMHERAPREGVRRRRRGSRRGSGRMRGRRGGGGADDDEWWEDDDEEWGIGDERRERAPLALRKTAGVTAPNGAATTVVVLADGKTREARDGEAEGETGGKGGRDVASVV